MDPYVIFCDSSCDLKTSLLKEWGIQYSNLRFHFDGENTEYLNDDMPAKQFFDRMRAGDVARTSAVNPKDFIDAFEKILKEGKDILYIGFSSGLSATYNSGAVAAQMLRGKYPERRILLVDTFGASAGYGLILYLAKEERDKGRTIEKVKAFVEKTRFHLCHWFTVDDLTYLTRGGRVATIAAKAAGALQIKPVMHMDDPGHLVPAGVVRGRKNSLKAIVKHYGKLALHPAEGPVFLCHSDCMEDVMFLAHELKEQYGVDIDLITDIGPVIGAHTGPGCIALFFLGSER